MSLKFSSDAAYEKWVASLPERSRLRLATLDGLPVAAVTNNAPLEPGPAKRQPDPKKAPVRPSRPRVRWPQFMRPSDLQILFMVWFSGVMSLVLGLLWVWAVVDGSLR